MRSLWKGSISFGLINVPVGVVSASRDHELKFTLLHKNDLSEIRYARICKEEEKEVPYGEIVKAFNQEGHYKILSPEEFKEAESKQSKLIEIVAFCDYNQIDSLYYEKPYFLTVEKGSDKAYFLLHNALLETGKVAVVQYVLKNHNHIAIIKPYKHLLVLDQMRYHSQIRNIDEISVTETIKISPKELDMAIKLIDQLGQDFNAADYHDSYIENLQKTINKKKSAHIKTKEKTQKSAQVYDLMSLLKASLNQKPKASKKRAGTK